MTKSVKSNYVLGLINAGVIIWYLWTDDFPGNKAIIAFYIFIALIFALLIIEAIKPIFRSFFAGFHIIVFSVLFSFFILEGLGRIFYDQIPIQVRYYYDPWQSEKSSKSDIEPLIDYLDQSPYGKFMPNRVITQNGARGDDFVYQYITDGQGFKNYPKLFAQDNIDIVAVGDSFTEGMGVSIEDTWTSKLSKKGLVSYNLGVQGYAPIQMAGVFELFGVKYKPKHVLIGYYSSRFERNDLFLDYNLEDKNRKFSGGIEILRLAHNQGNEIRLTFRYFVSAIYALVKSEYLKSILSASKSFEFKLNPPFDKYGSELASIGGKYEQGLVRKIKQNDPAWKSTLQSFKEISQMANSIDAKTTMLYFPSRGMVYYEAATGEPVKIENVEALEIEQFKLFCKTNGINFIDLTPVLKGYLDNIIVSSDLNDNLNLLPYFAFDGHLNKVGNEIVSEYLYKELITSSK